MKPGIQSFLSAVGESGCYALCILQLAGATDIVDKLEQAIDKRFIKFNYNDYDDDDNFFVMDPAGMLSWLTGKKWAVTKEGPAYLPRPGELVVNRWERVKTGSVTAHFRLPVWDPLIDSATIRYGTIASKRVFRCVK